MKKLHFKTSKGEFLLVEDDGNFPRDFPYEFYEGIGYIENLTEKQADSIVDEGDATPSSDRYKNGYKCYLTGEDDYWCETALESFNDLLESLDVHFENPISNDDRSRFAEWVEWRKKVWDKENTYLFRKI